MELEQHQALQLSLLTVVANRDKSERMTAILEQHHVAFGLVGLGRGTATSHILNYLGLGYTENVLFLSIMPTHEALKTLDVLDEMLQLKAPGHGIAFITAVHQGCYHRPVEFATTNSEGELAMENLPTTHDLILVVANRGYTEEVMDAARAAGATGGTVLHARGCGLPGAEKFFGVTIQHEKELVMIVAPVEISFGIMGSIAGTAGPGTNANAISFSLPVGSVRGLAKPVGPDALV